MEDGHNTPLSYIFPTISDIMVPQYSASKQVTMAIVHTLQVMINSPPACLVSDSLNTLPSKDTHANDWFVGSDLLTLVDYSRSNRTDLTSFQPKMLTVYHLALLAHVVHLQYPIYLLFKDQCYWFASLVYYATQIIDRNLADAKLHADNYADLNTFQDFLKMPLHLYQSTMSGC